MLRRRSVRLPIFDYRTPTAYFVTICTRDRAPLFGRIVEDIVHLTEVGRIVEEEWQRTAVLRPYVRLDVFVVMPDHAHGVVWIVDDIGGGNALCRGAARCAPTPQVPDDGFRRVFGDMAAGSLSVVVRAFKSAVTRRINEMRETPGSAVWQRGFYEHVVRNERDLARIRRYIAENPARWANQV